MKTQDWRPGRGDSLCWHSQEELTKKNSRQFPGFTRPRDAMAKFTNTRSLASALATNCLTRSTLPSHWVRRALTVHSNNAGWVATKRSGSINHDGVRPGRPLISQEALLAIANTNSVVWLCQCQVWCNWQTGLKLKAVILTMCYWRICSWDIFLRVYLETTPGDTSHIRKTWL